MKGRKERLWAQIAVIRVHGTIGYTIEPPADNLNAMS
jgi:hypothetical protein